MQLSAIVEALLIASQNPLAAEEIARLVRARVAEAEDIRVRETEEGKEPPPCRTGWWHSPPPHRNKSPKPSDN